MEAYIYQAALLCELCAETVKATTDCPGNPDDENTFDSDDYPKGPYPNGGGEADTPQHCDHCGVFLENPLTGDGEDYVREAISDHYDTGRGNADVIEIWRSEYAYLFEYIS